MNKAILAGVAAVAIISSSAVYAKHRHHHHHHHQKFSADDKAALVDARIAAVKAGLRLSPEQEKNWPAVETAVRDFAKQRIARATARASEREAHRAERQKARKDGKAAEQAAPRSAPDLVKRLHDRADVMAEKAAGLKRIADAADPLYKSLDDGQKRRLKALTRMAGRFGFGGMGHFGRDSGRDHHHGRRDRDGGGEHRGPADGQPQRL